MFEFPLFCPHPLSASIFHWYQRGRGANHGKLVCSLCFTSHRQRGHLETAPAFTVPCEGRESGFLHRSHRGSNPGPSRGSPLHYRCTTPAYSRSVLFVCINARVCLTSMFSLPYITPSSLLCHFIYTFSNFILYNV